MKIILETIRKPEDLSFACGEFRGREFECPYHHHPEFEVLLIEKSRGRALVGDAAFSFRPGQVFLFPPDLPHLFHNERRGAGLARSRFVQFRRDCFGLGFWDLPENRRANRLLRDAVRGLLWEGRAAARASALIEGLYQAPASVRLGRLLDVLDHLSRSRPTRVLASSGYEHVADEVAARRIDRVLTVLHDNAAKETSLDAAARLAGLSTSGFSRFFRKATGRSFWAYVIELRISEARRLLIESDRTVAEVCFECGFSNLSNFNRHFRARCGKAPREWRQTILREASHF